MISRSRKWLLSKDLHLEVHLELHLELPSAHPATFRKLNPIWTGGGGSKMDPLKIFAKYLKNDLVDLHETL